MRRFLLPAAWVLVLGGLLGTFCDRLGHAQLLWTQPIQVGSSSGGSYVGVGNIVSGWAIWGGVQAYSLAYATSHSNLFTIERASDSSKCNVPSLSSGLPGLLAGCSGSGNGSTVASFCTSTTCYMAFYDQSGNGHDFTANSTV